MESRNYANELHHYYMWSQDNLAALIDVTRPKAKKIIDGSAKPNNIQEALLKEVCERQLTYKKFTSHSIRAYRLQLLRESES